LIASVRPDWSELLAADQRALDASQVLHQARTSIVLKGGKSLEIAREGNTLFALENGQRGAFSIEWNADAGVATVVHPQGTSTLELTGLTSAEADQMVGSLSVQLLALSQLSPEELSDPSKVQYLGPIAVVMIVLIGAWVLCFTVGNWLC